MTCWHIKMNGTLCSLRGERKRPINLKGPSQLQQERYKMPSVNIWAEARFPSSAARKWQAPPHRHASVPRLLRLCLSFPHRHTVSLILRTLSPIGPGDWRGKRVRGSGRKKGGFETYCFPGLHSAMAHILPTLNSYIHLYLSQILNLNADLILVA